jgi:hypothetical protein
MSRQAHAASNALASISTSPPDAIGTLQRNKSERLAKFPSRAEHLCALMDKVVAHGDRGERLLRRLGDQENRPA